MRHGQIRIGVTDQGPGIPQSFHGHMFQKFSQADASDTRQKGGTGLGLSIAKAIVECHGGRQNSVDAIAFGSLSAAFDPAGMMTPYSSGSQSGDGPVAMLLGNVSGPDESCRKPIRLLDWVEKPVDFDRLRRRIEGAELAGFSRTPLIVCLGFAGNRAACDTMALQEPGIPAPKAVQTKADPGSLGRVHLAIIDAGG